MPHPGAVDRRPGIDNAEPDGDDRKPFERVGAMSAGTRKKYGNRHIPGRHDVIGAPLDSLTLGDCLDAADRAIENGHHIVHTSVNAAKIVRIQHDQELKDALWDADLSTADGQPVVWAARLLGRPVPSRVAGIDLMNALLAHAAAREYTVYLLGARPAIVSAAADRIRSRHPLIRIAGYRHGYFSPDDDAAVAAEIAGHAPDLLFVALETPRKELFIARRRDELRAGFAMGVGGALDVLAGRRKRAPRWLQFLGLEWAFRLMQEPRRLGWRYAIGNSRFLALLGRELSRKSRQSGRGGR
jgi:N-acetylglucosaminyldiphosphoundecaprenol N-acetyl-beta-D-mannosaminyltransferase